MSTPRPVSAASVFRNDRVWLLLLLLATALGTALRFHMLGAKSFWLDEGSSVYFARLPWPTFLRTMWWGEANMALYYVLLRGWLHLGHTEFWLRSVSALVGVAAIPAVYAFGSRFISRDAGILAASLLALHSFHIEYSQELRSYSLLTFLIIVSSYFFLAMLDAPGRKSAWLLYVGFSALSIYAHIFAVFAIASQWLILTPARIRRLGVVRLLAAGAGIAVLAAPIAAVVLLEHKSQLDWVPPLRLAGVWEMFRDLVGGAAGPQALAVSVSLFSLYVATWIVAVVLSFRHETTGRAEPMTRATLSLLISWLGFPVVAIMGVSILKPMLAPRYLLMCVPAAVLLAGWGLAAIADAAPRGRLVSAAVFVSMVALAFAGVRDYYIGFKNYGHDWRKATEYILRHQAPGEAVIFYTFSGHNVFDYYASREMEAGTASAKPVVLFPLDLERAVIEKRTQSYRRVWLVIHQTRSTPFTDSQTELLRTALATHFRLLDEREFLGSGKDLGENGEIRVLLYAAIPTT